MDAIQAETTAVLDDERWRVQNRATRRWATDVLDDKVLADRKCKTLNVTAFNNGGYARAYVVVPVDDKGLTQTNP